MARWSTCLSEDGRSLTAMSFLGSVGTGTLYTDRRKDHNVIRRMGAAVASGWHRRPRTAAATERARVYATPEHKAMVHAVKAAVAAGTAHCWRCGRHIPPGSKAHAGHDDHDRTLYRGVECPQCNLVAAAKKGARIRNARAKARQTRTTRLTW